MLTPNSDLESLAHRFAWAAEHQYAKSPLYQRFCRAIVDDPEILALAAHAGPGQPRSNLLFGAVHSLLLSGVAHPLADFYPSLAGTKVREGDPAPAFQEFCREYRGEIQRLLETRRVQTNEVQRCACLLPAFSWLAPVAAARPWALVEVGASAGLNLLWDRFGYEFSDGRRCGNPRSAVELTLTLRGDQSPPLFGEFPNVIERIGIDLDPVNVFDRDATAWLRALIWPEQTERASRLEQALALARNEPPTVQPGDALEKLPELLAAAPREAFVCLYHSFMTNQLSMQDQDRLAGIIASAGAGRDLADVALEWRQGELLPSLRLRTFQGGHSKEQFLGWCDDHGAWLEWQAT